MNKEFPGIGASERSGDRNKSVFTKIGTKFIRGFMIVTSSSKLCCFALAESTGESSD